MIPVPIKVLAAATSAAILAGCAAPDLDTALRDANAMAAPAARTVTAELATTPAQREARARLSEDLLSRPLDMDGAAQLALANSPAFQALLAQGWAELASARSRGLPSNPVFTFEHLRDGPQLEIGRLLSVGLVDLLTWPGRSAVARVETEQARVRLAVAIVDQANLARSAWVQAVAAREIERYATQVKDTAEASAELARRMKQAGNFTKLQEARQHLFYADATSRLAAARQNAVAARERLVRTLGLSDAQAGRLMLPDRLPELPKAALGPGEVARAAGAQRLDARLARLEVEAAGRARGIDLVPSFVDVELGLRHDTTFDDATGERSNRRGYELDVALPVFDWGRARRAGLDARALAAANRYEAVSREAGSQLREAYSAYRTAFELAQHQRDEVVPLRRAVGEENLLRYNGMLIGVFELLADARDQVQGVIAAIEASRDFWLADAALAATLVGRPLATAPAMAGAGATAASQDASH